MQAVKILRVAMIVTARMVSKEAEKSVTKLVPNIKSLMKLDLTVLACQTSNKISQLCRKLIAMMLMNVRKISISGVI